jgi:SRP-independent targeting protein 2/TMEM208
VGTKGSKQIVEENIATLKFYRNMSLIACGIFLLATLLIKSITGTIITMSIITFIIHGAAYQFMRMMSRPQLTEQGAIIDCGKID